MEYPLVTVVIPTYNRPAFLRRCIHSVIHQSYPNIEVFVVDDNNPDTEARIATEKEMEFFRDNSNVFYLKHLQNQNGSAARNTGWRASSGDYITFLDDDDEIAETKIEKQVRCLESLDDSWGMCYTSFKVVKGHGANQISSEKRAGNCYLFALMRTLFMGSGSNLLLRRSVVDEINGYDESFQRNQDIEFLARACEKYKLAFVNEILLTIYQDENRERRTFEQIERYTQHYLDKFHGKIEALDSDDKERVMAVISLERFRCAMMNRKTKQGFRILSENNVKFKYITRYICYICRRVITHESYGFDGR